MLVVPEETLIAQEVMVVIHLLLPVILLMLLPLEVEAAVGDRTALLLILMAVMADLVVAVVLIRAAPLLLVLEPLDKEIRVVLGRLKTTEAAVVAPVLLVVMLAVLLEMVEMELHLLLPVLL